MNKDNIAQLKQNLLDSMSALKAMEQSCKTAQATVELDQTTVGRLSRMDAMQMQQMALETARRRQQQLVKIEGALRRIASAEYGYCFICGEQIVIERLFADPTCTRCTACVE